MANDDGPGSRRTHSSRSVLGLGLGASWLFARDTAGRTARLSTSGAAVAGTDSAEGQRCRRGPHRRRERRGEPPSRLRPRRGRRCRDRPRRSRLLRLGTDRRSWPPRSWPSCPRHDRKGYWLIGADGSVYPFGDAKNEGGAGGKVGAAAGRRRRGHARRPRLLARHRRRPGDGLRRRQELRLDHLADQGPCRRDRGHDRRQGILDRLQHRRRLQLRRRRAYHGSLGDRRRSPTRSWPWPSRPTAAATGSPRRTGTCPTSATRRRLAPANAGDRPLARASASPSPRPAPAPGSSSRTASCSTSAPRPLTARSGCGAGVPGRLDRGDAGATFHAHALAYDLAEARRQVVQALGGAAYYGSEPTAST